MKWKRLNVERLAKTFMEQLDKLKFLFRFSSFWVDDVKSFFVHLLLIE